MAPDDGAVEPEALAQLDRLGKVARRDRDLVPVDLEVPDQRAHYEHVGAVGQIDPDAHRARNAI
jgi:hypothetical protein